MQSGIYKIVNIANGKLYVGSAVDIKDRWRRHKRKLRKNDHHSSHLQGAWNKYREINFRFEIIEGCEEERLIEREQFWIDHYQSYKREKGYNMCPKAGNTSGVVHSDQSRKNMSEGHADFSGENNPNFGKHHSKKTKEKIRLAHIGSHHSEQAKKNMSKARRGENAYQTILNWNIVHEIRRRYKEEKTTCEQLGIEYGVSKSCIQYIISGRTWKEEGSEKIVKGNRGENSYIAKLTWIQVHEIRRRYKEGNISYMKLAAEYGVSVGCIREIIQNRNWKEESTKEE